MGGTREQQMERYSRSWVVAAAAGADYTYETWTDDVHGVDMVVRNDHHILDFQLKSTSHPLIDRDDIVFDLPVGTYDKLRKPNRAGYGVLVLVVVDGDCDRWLSIDHERTHLARAAYYLPLHGCPATGNTAKTRLRVPRANLLTINAMKWLMAQSAARWAV